MSASPNYSMTPEEYLVFERASETKHEYIDGEIYAMAGAQPNHSFITVNISTSFNNQLDDRIPPCYVCSPDQRVRIFERSYVYPDVTVVCGEPIYEPTGLDTLINPTLIVEVLSPSTERYDRLTKAHYYQQIESLGEYLFVAQDAHWIERFTRQPNNKWDYATLIGIDSIVELASIDCTLPLANVYKKIVFKAKE